MALNENPTLEEIVDEIERLNNLIVNRGGTKTITPKTTNQVLSKGYYKGDITVKGDVNLIASNILSGKSIFGVSGNVTVSSLGGKKWAKGTAIAGPSSKSFNYMKANTFTSKYITIPKPDFDVSNIIFVCKDTNYGSFGFYANNLNQYYTNYPKYVLTCYKYSSTSLSNGMPLNIKADEVVVTSNSFIIPIGGYEGEYEWIAFE